jgi:hypothetical protein
MGNRQGDFNGGDPSGLEGAGDGQAHGRIGSADDRDDSGAKQARQDFGS